MSVNRCMTSALVMRGSVKKPERVVVKRSNSIAFRPGEATGAYTSSNCSFLLRILMVRGTIWNS